MCNSAVYRSLSYCLPGVLKLGNGKSAPIGGPLKRKNCYASDMEYVGPQDVQVQFTQLREDLSQSLVFRLLFNRCVSWTTSVQGQFQAPALEIVSRKRWQRCRARGAEIRTLRVVCGDRQSSNLGWTSS